VFQALASLDPLLAYLELLEGGERGRLRRPNRRGNDDDDDGTVGGGGRHVGPPADPAVRERGGGRRGKEDGEVGDDRPLLRNYDYDDDDIALVVVAVLFLLRGQCPGGDERRGRPASPIPVVWEERDFAIVGGRARVAGFA